MFRKKNAQKKCTAKKKNPKFKRAAKKKTKTNTRFVEVKIKSEAIFRVFFFAALLFFDQVCAIAFGFFLAVHPLYTVWPGKKGSFDTVQKYDVKSIF